MFVADDTSQSLVSQMNGVHTGRQADGPHPSAGEPLPLHSFYCRLPRAIVPAYRLDQSGNTPVSITIGLTLLELSTNYLSWVFGGSSARAFLVGSQCMASAIHAYSRTKIIASLCLYSASSSLHRPRRILFSQLHFQKPLCRHNVDRQSPVPQRHAQRQLAHPLQFQRILTYRHFQGPLKRSLRYCFRLQQANPVLLDRKFLHSPSLQ